MIDVKKLSHAELHKLKRGIQAELRLRYKGPEPIHHQSTIDELTRHA